MTTAWPYGVKALSIAPTSYKNGRLQVAFFDTCGGTPSVTDIHVIHISPQDIPPNPLEFTAGAISENQMHKISEVRDGV